MLRQKLLVNLGPLVVLLVGTSVVAILLLQGMLANLKHVHQDVWDAGNLIVREHALQEQEAALLWFRWLVLGLAMIFLLVINVSVMVLMRIAGMILRPVDKLVEATRQLAGEHFEYRVQVDQHDEFDELARAYNTLAESMQANEHRKIEVLGQVAVAMNHELNNAATIIDLQLHLLARQAHGNPALEKCLRQIHESLDRMTRTVQSLKNVRRIVLTDYNSGMKMLDLQRSIQEEQVPDPSAARVSTL